MEEIRSPIDNLLICFTYRECMNVSVVQLPHTKAGLAIRAAGGKPCTDSSVREVARDVVFALGADGITELTPCQASCWPVEMLAEVMAVIATLWCKLENLGYSVLVVVDVVSVRVVGPPVDSAVSPAVALVDPSRVYPGG